MEKANLLASFCNPNLNDLSHAVGTNFDVMGLFMPTTDLF